MPAGAPDFFLASSEGIAFRDSRKCWIEAKLAAEGFKSEFLLVRIDPAAVDPLTKELLDRIIITGRFDLAFRAKLPSSVNIAKIKDAQAITAGGVSASSVQWVDSGTIFASEHDAVEFARSGSGKAHKNQN